MQSTIVDSSAVMRAIESAAMDGCILIFASTDERTGHSGTPQYRRAWIAYTPCMSPSVALQYLLPQKTLSRVVRAATRWRWRPWKNFLIARVVKRYRVDMSEAAQHDPFAYPHFNAFFTRALKPGARHAGGGEMAVLCPADGRISQAGRIGEGRVLQAKGRDFGVTEL